MTTKARKVCDRAATACAKAYEALLALADFIPIEQSDRYSHWLKELREYGEYLEDATWPDKIGQKQTKQGRLL